MNRISETVCCLNFAFSDFANLSGKNSSPSVSEHEEKHTDYRTHADNFLEKEPREAVSSFFIPCTSGPCNFYRVLVLKNARFDLKEMKP